MAEPHTPTSLTNTVGAIHTVPLPGEAKVLIFVEAKVSSTNAGVGVSSRRVARPPSSRSTAKRVRAGMASEGR